MSTGSGRRGVGGHELTADVEDPCPLSVVAGGVEDESVVIEEGSGALGPQDHDGHVFQVCGDREFGERAWPTVGAQIMLASPAPLEGEEGESLFLEFHPGVCMAPGKLRGAPASPRQVGRTVKVCLGAGPLAPSSAFRAVPVGWNPYKLGEQ